MPKLEVRRAGQGVAGGKVTPTYSSSLGEGAFTAVPKAIGAAAEEVQGAAVSALKGIKAEQKAVAERALKFKQQQEKIKLDKFGNDAELSAIETVNKAKTQYTGIDASKGINDLNLWKDNLYQSINNDMTLDDIQKQQYLNQVDSIYNVKLKEYGSHVATEIKKAEKEAIETKMRIQKDTAYQYGNGQMTFNESVAYVRDALKSYTDDATAYKQHKDLGDAVIAGRLDTGNLIAIDALKEKIGKGELDDLFVSDEHKNDTLESIDKRRDSIIKQTEIEEKKKVEARQNEIQNTALDVVTNPKVTIMDIEKAIDVINEKDDKGKNILTPSQRRTVSNMLNAKKDALLNPSKDKTPLDFETWRDLDERIDSVDQYTPESEINQLNIEIETLGVKHISEAKTFTNKLQANMQGKKKSKSNMNLDLVESMIKSTWKDDGEYVMQEIVEARKYHAQNPDADMWNDYWMGIVKPDMEKQNEEEAKSLLDRFVEWRVGLNPPAEMESDNFTPEQEAEFQEWGRDKFKLDGSIPELNGKPAGRYKIDGRIIKWDGTKEIP